MKGYVDENIVMQFYLDLMEQDQIIFLQGKESKKADIRTYIQQLMQENKMNSKIRIACDLWKALFDASMSYISPDKQGYDKLFKYFDAYVEFEELIFASDSFYRDHTLHCIWVYFLGEYIQRKEEFQDLFADMNSLPIILDAIKEVFSLTTVKDEKDYRTMEHSLNMMKEILRYDEAARCVRALTHDLGYPLKKIEKINKSIKKVLPYFAVNHFDDFTFEYSNIQQEFVSSFLNFISCTYSLNFNPSKEAGEILMRALETDSYGNTRAVKKEILTTLTEEEQKAITNSCTIQSVYRVGTSEKIGFCNDFEEYRHGIMSAFLLCKNLRAFQFVDYDYKNEKLMNSSRFPDEIVVTLQTILASISNHTSDMFKISKLDMETYLTFVDELEEFSRISRASQNREYVEEFCDTSLTMEDGWLNITFEFNNANLDNLNPEISFKGRCKRFLSLFDIPDLSPNLKLRVTCIGKLPTDQNTYMLEIAQNHADIQINGESMNIPKYLKSNQFYTKEEYQARGC